MSDKLTQFTQQARRVLQLAKEEAELMRHNYIGTEHVLLGLVQEEDSIAGNVLRGLGATPERVKLLVYQMIGSGKQQLIGDKLDLTPRTKQVIEFAVDEKRNLQQTNIGPEHLLLAVIKQKDGVAIDVLRRIGLKPDQLRKDVLHAITHGFPDDSITRLVTIKASQYFPKKPIKLGLTDAAKASVDDVLTLFDTANSDMIAKLGEHARTLLAQYNQQQDKPE